MPHADRWAVLFDRDGTLVHDVPYNGDPARVRIVPGARDALRQLRAAGAHVGLVTNQSGVARGVLDLAAVDAVNRRLGALVGGFDVVCVCPHADDARCSCRKPAPGMVLAAAAALGVTPGAVWVVGDIAADVAAARAAGAAGVLVPNAATRSDEVHDATVVAGDLSEAVRLVLAARGAATRRSTTR